MKLQTLIPALSLCAALGPAWGQTPLPDFEATALTGQTVTRATLLGTPTVLIVTPSRAAAEQTREWAVALRDRTKTHGVKVRDVLAIDLPFFMSERDALGRAKEKIPKRYHDQTWLLAEAGLERTLGIPTDSGEAHVIVLDRQGSPIARVRGAPTPARIQELEQALQQLKAAR